MRGVTFLLAAAFVAAPFTAMSFKALAQDALAVGPNVYKKVLENNRIRVLEGTFKPGAKLSVHSHPDHLLYVLTDGSLTFKPSGRTPFEMTFKAGEAFSLPAQARAAENDGDKDVRVLVVELKSPAPSARPAARGKRVGKGAGKGAGKAQRKRRR